MDATHIPFGHFHIGMAQTLTDRWIIEVTTAGRPWLARQRALRLQRKTRREREEDIIC